MTGRIVELPLEPGTSTMRIPGGEEILVRIGGTHEGVNAVPGDLRLEAPPCFAAAPRGDASR